MTKRTPGREFGRSGFTLIELLIVIAIILILIAIALPNFLEAQARAKMTREKSDQRAIATAIESLRIDRGVLLVDFWDDDSGNIVLARFGRGCGEQPANPLFTEPPTFRTCCCWQGHDRRSGTSGMFMPLTTPVAYLQEVPRDPFAFEDGDQALIPEDVLPPISYMYHDREKMDENLDGGFFPGSGNDWRGVPAIYQDPPAFALGIIKPLSIDHYILVGFGPDLVRYHDRPYPYSATNGTKSFGDVIYRSDGGN